MCAHERSNILFIFQGDNLVERMFSNIVILQGKADGLINEINIAACLNFYYTLVFKYFLYELLNKGLNDFSIPLEIFDFKKYYRVYS